MKMSSWCWVLVSAMTPMRAGAQDEATTKAASRAAPAVFDPTVTSAASLPQPTLVFRASTDEQSAALRLGKNLGDTLLGDVSLGATLSGSLGKGEKSTTLANLEGLTGATSVAIQASLFNWRPKPPDPQKARVVCKKHIDKDSCSRGELPTEAAKKEWDDLNDYGNPWLINGQFKIGRQSFDYFEAANSTSTTEDTTPWSLGFGAGVVGPGLGYIGVSYRHEQAFRGGEQTQVCTPLAGTDALRCDTLTLGAPRKTSSNIGSIEARLFSRYIAVNPRASYDFSNEVLGLELPVYFVQNEDSGFTAGVNVGWRSDTRTATATLFIGAALNLLPQ